MKKIYNLARKYDTYEDFVIALKKSKNRVPQKIVDNILISTYYNMEDIRSKSRKRELVDIRMIISYVLTIKGYSETQIADIINRDRTTVMYHRDKAGILLDYDPIFKEKYNQIVN